MADEPLKLTSAEFEQEFFVGADKMTLEIELLEKRMPTLKRWGGRLMVKSLLFVRWSQLPKSSLKRVRFGPNCG
jgi:hypothetical protein